MEENDEQVEKLDWVGRLKSYIKFISFAKAG